MVVSLLAAYGLCFGLVNEKIPFSQHLRKISLFDQMLSCSFCTGFWSGILVWMVTSGLKDPTSGIVFAFASAAFCYAIDNVLQLVEKHL